MRNFPDTWVIIKIKTSETSPEFFKVFGGWYGGYGGSDSWKLNSGIVKYEIKDNQVDFYGSSGSVYSCKLNYEQMSAYQREIYGSYKKQAEGRPEVTFEHVSFEEFKQKFNNQGN